MLVFTTYRRIDFEFLNVFDHVANVAATAGFLLAIFVAFLSLAHQSRLLAECLIVLIQGAKQEARNWRRTWRRLKNVLTTWSSDD
jgi:hypothetical protein